MSADKPVGKAAYFAAGVFKLDYKVAGYRDLKKIAQDWAKHPAFHELIVRHVSQTNFGIQFVYITKQPQPGKMRQFREQLETEFGSVYAIDYAEYTLSPATENVCEGVVVLKGLPTFGE